MQLVGESLILQRCILRSRILLSTKLAELKQRLGNSCRWLWRGDEHLDAFEKQVRLDVSCKQEERIRLFFNTACYGLFVWLIMMMIDWYFGVLGVRSPTQHVPNIMRCFAWCLVAVVAKMFPSCVRVKSCTCFFAMAYVLHLVFLGFVPTAQNLMNNLQVYAAGRLVLAVFSPSSLVTVAFTIVNGAAICFRYIYLLRSIPASEKPMEIHVFIQGQLYITSLTFLVHAVIRQSTIAEIRANLKLAGSNNARVTVESLLAVTCDAVVHLDAHFRICGPCKKLAAMLMTDMSLEGRSFLNFMLESEVDQFRKQFTSRIAAAEESEEPSQNPMHAQAFNLTLRCGSGVPVKTSIVHATFNNLEPRDNLILGIFEQATQEGHHSHLNEPDRCLSETMGRVGNKSSKRSVASLASSDISMPLGIDAGVYEYGSATSLKIDALTVGWPVLSTSDAFVLRFGRIEEGTLFMHWIQNACDFGRSLQEASNDFEYGDPTLCAISAKLIFKTPLTHDSGVEYAATCSFLFDDGLNSESDELDNPEYLHALITMHQIRERITMHRESCPSRPSSREFKEDSSIRQGRPADPPIGEA